MFSRAAKVVACLLVAAPSAAADSGNDRAAVSREIGSVLAWRLGPEAVEEACRTVDPAGAEARKKSMQGWLEKNAALIRQVDERVAEVVPLAFQAPANVDAVQAVRGQVKKILLEPMLSATPEQAMTLCKEEADPANPRWKSNGMPHVQEALAALYDWKIQRSAK